MDAFHAQKCSARQTPPNAARASSPLPSRFQSRHSPLVNRKPATMIREKPKRQRAIASGSAAESRTSGPANEIPTRESASTQYGFSDIKKRAGASAPALFQDNLSQSSGFSPAAFPQRHVQHVSEPCHRTDGSSECYDRGRN